MRRDIHEHNCTQPYVKFMIVVVKVGEKAEGEKRDRESAHTRLDKVKGERRWVSD